MCKPLYWYILMYAVHSCSIMHATLQPRIACMNHFARHTFLFRHIVSYSICACAPLQWTECWFFLGYYVASVAVIHIFWCISPMWVQGQAGWCFNRRTTLWCGQGSMCSKWGGIQDAWFSKGLTHNTCATLELVAIIAYIDTCRLLYIKRHLQSIYLYFLRAMSSSCVHYVQRHVDTCILL